MKGAQVFPEHYSKSYAIYGALHFLGYFAVVSSHTPFFSVPSTILGNSFLNKITVGVGYEEGASPIS